MSRTPTIDGKITATGLAAKLRDMGELPVVLRIAGQRDVALETGQTFVSSKAGRATDYGTLDLRRILVDTACRSTGMPVTADVLAGRLNTDDHVSLSIWSTETSLMLDRGVSVRREDVGGIMCCVIETRDHDDV